MLPSTPAIGKPFDTSIRLPARYCLGMKNQSANTNRSLTGSMLKPILDTVRKDADKTHPVPVIESEKLKPAALYQDDGSSYNTSYDFPQE